MEIFKIYVICKNIQWRLSSRVTNKILQLLACFSFNLFYFKTLHLNFSSSISHNFALHFISSAITRKKHFFSFHQLHNIIRIVILALSKTTLPKPAFKRLSFVPKKKQFDKRSHGRFAKRNKIHVRL